MKKVKFQNEARTKLRSNFAFEADAVSQRTASCCVRAPRGSTRRWASKTMNRMIRLLALSLSFLCVPVFAAEPLNLGVLEEPQCKDGAPRAVRPLFAKKNTEWLALNSKEAAAGFGLDRIEWTAAFDGKNIGQFISTDPRKDISPEWTYPRDHLHVLESGKALPEIKNKLKAFSGWCDAPQYYPIVLVSEPNFQDPEKWKRAAASVADKKELFRAFKEATKNASLCQVSKNDKPKPYNYGQDDLQIMAAYRNTQNEQLVSVTLRKQYFACDSELGWPETPIWFLLNNTFRHIGNNLTLIDAGDYDKDGKSEVLFWYSGYNRDGYVLFYNDFKNKADFIWSYH